MYIVLYFLFTIILVEATTELVVKSAFFLPVRKFMFDHSRYRVFDFLHALLDCGYCFSVWAGWFIAILFYTNGDFCFIHKNVDWVFIGIFLHRMSNLLHYTIDCFRKWSDNGQGI